jgi:hypothetical protein
MRTTTDAPIDVELRMNRVREEIIHLNLKAMRLWPDELYVQKRGCIMLLNHTNSSDSQKLIKNALKLVIASINSFSNVNGFRVHASNTISHLQVLVK